MRSLPSRVIVSPSRTSTFESSKWKSLRTRRRSCTVIAHDYVFVTLGASEVENDIAGKPPVTLKFEDGETAFTDIAKNLSDQPFRNGTMELL